MAKPSEHPHAPQLMPLKPAVRQIVAALREQRQERSADFPFFLIVGAGISAPAVPLADGLVALCQERCKAQGIPPEELPTAITDPLDRYAAWFKAAYPHRADRQRFFIKLIERAPVSPAVLRLAHLLLPDAQPLLESTAPGPSAPRTRPLTNVVVTPNFDDLLARGLRLFGADTVVCDHPRVTERIDLDRHDVLQLVHVHGSYRFYDGCNLRTEIEERARHDEDGSSESMLGLLQVLLRDRSPIVVGYSGWEGDVIMTALRQRLERSAPLPRNLYWFCYRRSEADILPNWLTDHADVRLVVPDPLPPDATRTASGERAIQVAAPRTDDSLDDPGTLPATRVFEELIARLELQPPRLTDDPLGFFADHLERLLPQDHEPAARDVYAVRSVIARVRRGVKLEREAQTQPVREAADRIKLVLDAVRRADFDTAVVAAQDIPLEAVDDAQRLELEAAIEEASVALNGVDTALQACNLRVRIAEFALASAPHLEWQVRHARALYGIGYCQDEAKRFDEALVAYDRVLSLYGYSAATSLQERAAWALVNKGVALGRLGKFDDAINAYNEVERRFGSATEPALREAIAAALFDKGLALGALGRYDDAITVYDEIERRFRSASEPELREQVADALLNKGVALGTLGRSEDAIATYHEVARRFASEFALREQVAIALFNKGVRLGVLRKPEQEIAVYDEVERRFGAAAEPALREQIAGALFNKGVALGTLGHAEAAIAVYDDIERRFGSASEPALREQVAKALVNKGVSLATLGKPEKAIAIYDEVEHRFGAAAGPALREQVAWALANRGVTLGTLGQAEAAIAVYDEVERRFGSDERPGTRETVEWARAQRQRLAESKTSG